MHEDDFCVDCGEIECICHELAIEPIMETPGEELSEETEAYMNHILFGV